MAGEGESLHRQGVDAARAGRPAEARALIERAIAADPGVAAWRANLGLVLEQQGDPTAAALAYAGALAIDPGLTAAREGLLECAAAARAPSAYRAALALFPADAAAWANAGVLLRARAEREAAAACYRRAMALEPQSWVHPYNLGNALAEMNRLEAADGAYRAALVRAPDRAEVQGNRAARALAQQARPDEALAAAGRALVLHPEADSLHAMRLSLLQYDARCDTAALAAAHAAWGRRHPDRPPPATPAPAPRLRIGLVSPDFRAHPVGSFVEPVLEALDRRSFEVICYAHTANPDATTDRLRALAERWVWTTGLDDDALERTVRADGIHILVDLAGHTFGNRLPVFARRPAPVQATWAGYVGTTGLPAMDYLISDSRQSPEGAEAYGTEAIVRLPDAYVPWAPPADAPEPAPPPLTVRGHATFGSFNTLVKLNGAVAALWARVLAAVPDSRLVLRTPQLGDPGTAARVRALFAAGGVDPARLTLAGGLPRRDFLAAYADIDVALDPFPYAGGVTTLEALWMGVPVVTLGGERFCARHGVTHLTSAGLTELTTDGPDPYVSVAAALAADPVRLGALRTGLRERVRRSPACDGVRFTRALEAAWRTMWQRHAAGLRPASFTLAFG
ncbi:tetratricopeptide repeat protein [Azospirillum halopraeferens]|uniref:O-linked N-acetylglucosamine transferase, SPINDLY family protein n=1 Tax=Azospirillum halopraeferens TaxID=34010 RepID=UPI0004211E6E|nr:glycosyltransferase family 41 protein [Azospirillum halopraeferens]